MIDAIDWAVKNSGKGNYTHLDVSRIAVAGQSCGGLEAYSAGVDKRVGMYGIFNSGGNLMGTVTGGVATAIIKPVFYFLGGPTDVAYSSVSHPFPLKGKVLMVKGNRGLCCSSTWCAFLER